MPALFLVTILVMPHLFACGSRGSDAIESLLDIQESEKFLSYLPIGGFGNQMVGFRNALRLAGILNRTLIVPPLMMHGEHEIGVCQADGVLQPRHANWRFWKKHGSKIYNSTYLSMADIVDISGLDPNLVRTIDLRLFAALKCGIDVSDSLSFCAWCQPFLRRLKEHQDRNFPEKLDRETLLKHCGAELGYFGLDYVTGYDRRLSVYREKKDCMTSIFMFLREANGTLSSRFRDTKNSYFDRCPHGRQLHLKDWYNVKYTMELRKKKKLPPLIFVNVLEHLGREWSQAKDADVISIGSTFNVFDLQMPTGDSHVDEISCATEYLPFNPEIMKGAMDYVAKKLPDPFVCIHFRGSDGFFMSERSKNLAELQKRFTTSRATIHTARSDYWTFLMTDLKSSKWEVEFQSLLNTTKIEFGHDLPNIEAEIREKSFSRGMGLYTNRIERSKAEAIVQEFWNSSVVDRVHKLTFEDQSVQGYIEQVVCSCAQLDFLGSVQSTFAGNIQRLIDGHVCSREGKISSAN